MRKDGSLVWSRTTVNLLKDAAGKPQLFLGVIEDITIRKATEVALRESEERFRAIVQATPECVKVVAPDGTLLAMNSAGCGMVEANRDEEIIGQSVYGLIAPEFRQRFIEFNENVCNGNKGQIEFQIIGLKGTRRWMETHAVPMRDPSTGQTVQLAVTRDVTARKEADEKLRRSEEELRTLGKFHPPTRVDGQSGRPVFFGTTGAGTNTPARPWIRWQVGVGRRCTIQNVLPRVMEKWTESIRTGAPFEMEFPLRGADGVFRWFLTRSQPVSRCRRQGHSLVWYQHQYR